MVTIWKMGGPVKSFIFVPLGRRGRAHECMVQGVVVFAWWGGLKLLHEFGQSATQQRPQPMLGRVKEA
jgi:hypothetical protein